MLYPETQTDISFLFSILVTLRGQLPWGFGGWGLECLASFLFYWGGLVRLGSGVPSLSATSFGCAQGKSETCVA